MKKRTRAEMKAELSAKAEAAIDQLLDQADALSVPGTRPIPRPDNEMRPTEEFG